ncbi:hypothetical protein [Pararhizobium antarcticum]|nr:hypothetical protein [Pararhizobium antarcticum]
MGQPVQIKFIDNDHIETDDWINGHPCIKVGVFYTPKPALGIDYSTTPAWALIDTGADHVYIEQEYLDNHQAPMGRPVHTNREMDASHIHRACVMVDQTGEVFDFQTVIGRRLTSSGQPFRVVLGRSFLSIFRFDFDPREKRALLHR